LNDVKSGKDPLCCFFRNDISRRERRKGDLKNDCDGSFLLGMKLNRRLFFGELNLFCSKCEVDACLGSVYEAGAEGICLIGMIVAAATGWSNTTINNVQC